ncbi:MAG TPA: glutamine-hydrolyzing carbamoyl-phosphate synthase small subunit [Phycisphaerae bacterium]|nr:glutamine-hydrolyzing carbamoyl-phosphate synthase small subunit [Phycisphaerae bacterium]
MAGSDQHACFLALEDGCIFSGASYGASGTSAGEVVFNTALTGYQEILTDPSYCGQIVTMTAPLMGNYGVNLEDMESGRPYLAGFVVKEPARRVSNHRASGSLEEYLKASGIVGIAGIDTRALTRRLRVGGAMRGVLSTEIEDSAELIARARAIKPMSGSNLVKQVTSNTTCVADSASENAKSASQPRVIVIDCGIKQNILRQIGEHGAAVTVLPPDTSADAILERKPHAILIGNGPGDPAAVKETIAVLKQLIGRVPIFGICLGHQLLALALGAETYKLKFGHHGANHPVLNTETGRVEITSQNHGFAVEEKSLERAGARLTHVNRYDGSVEGFSHPDKRLFAVQYHPESAPGPHDSRYLFEIFSRMWK